MCKIYFSHPWLKLCLVGLLAGICFFSPGTAFAKAGFEFEIFENPPQTVSGTVKDASTGKPLAGATINVKGGSQSTASDTRGAFTIVAPDNISVLVISYVGYVTQELPVTGNNIEVSMLPNSAELNQVVVVGYGTQNKRDVTGAVKSVKSEAFNRGIINSPQQLLQGKVSGVNVTSASGEPGSMQGITIRGPGGVRTGSTPLFVVDGLPLDNSSTGGGDPLNFINPQDIESFDVLKDASATAIYGSRGANGVIIITTKRGKAGVSTLAYSTSIGYSKIARALPVLTAEEFRAEVPKLGGAIDDQKGSTDWQKEITRTAFTQNHNLTMSGGAERLTYYASFGLQKQEGILKENSLDRYSGRFNATQRFWDDRLIIEANLNVANTKNQRPPIGGLIGDAISNNPTYPAYDANGKPIGYQNISNPLVYLTLDKDITTINRVIGNISPSLKLIKGLVYKLNFGVDNSNSNHDVEALPFAQPLRDGRLETFYNYNRNTLIENYLTYSFATPRHSVSALAGHSYQKIFVQGRNNSINRFPISPVEPIYNPGLGQELTLANNRPGGYAFINELQSFFGRVTYQLDNKYLLTANFRADGSSKFGSNNKYGLFPSFSLGWKISDEEFMSGSVFNNLKLRGGWGRTGNQEIPSKITQALYTSQVSASTSYPLYASGLYPAGTTFSRLANPDIQWEVSTQTDVGLDFGLWKGALSGSVDFFNKVSNNILLEVIPADPIQPANTFWTNVQDMTINNKGVEFDIEYRHKSNAGISYNIGGNLTYMHNKVNNSPYSVIPSGSASGSGLTSATINGYLNGEPIGTFFLKEFTGFDANGLSTYRDTDKDGIISDKDRIAAGTALPNIIYSFNGGAAYKGFDVVVNFNGVSGNKIYDNTANSYFYKNKLAKNVNTTREAIANATESTSNSAPVSTRFLKDGAYLRLNNLSLGYNFNTNDLGIKKWISAIRLSVTGQNLFVITNYNGFDPEVNTDRTINGISSYGIDYQSYPKAKSIIFGLNFSF
ncbi:SusC/RagA family TonB-linked outer membrane protein [Segetibacter aerophilus]|uniref:SusC/RagA family TonB-linked outer membrane protein n=1 Tax=Segetibacter aerophilus TaxID=670293 RepID=A0A512BER9_9BACT|nr:TonB-dependent receptor [Segetibacter aerophilus]GEO10469.1 SusC/RagA family TonB-linked outer membrane protein [Segetibacter aerophilus]